MQMCFRPAADSTGQPPELGRRPNLRAGFSLLEVMVALSIIALAATVVAPSLSASVGQASRRAAELELQASLIALRRTAVRSEQVVIASARTARSVRSQSGQDADWPQAEVLQLELPAPRGWTIAEGTRMVMLPDGSCRQATAVLRDGLGRAFQLEVSTACRTRD